MVVVTEKLTLECCREKDLAEGNIGERSKTKNKKIEIKEIKVSRKLEILQKHKLRTKISD